jgi:hypothetical protein
LTRSSIILAVVGVLLIVAAAVVRFAVVPSVTTLPEDLDVTLRFEGTYNGINPAALSGGEGELLANDVPIEASRRVQAESVDGDTEIVSRTDTRTVGDGEPSVTQVLFNVDRETAAARPAPDGADDVTSAEGLVFTLPVDPSTAEGTYEYWDQYTMQSAPVTFEGEETFGGRDVNRYQSVADGELADPAALGLPASLPKSLAALAPDLADSVDPGLTADLDAALAALPDEVPIAWTSNTTTFVDADRELGATIAGGSTQVITGTLDFGGYPVVVEFATIDIYSTDDSIDERGSDVGDQSSLLNLVGTVLPIVALILGLLLLVAAAVLAVRAARRAGAPSTGGASQAA